MSEQLTPCVGACREAKEVVLPAGAGPGGLASCPKTEGESNYDVEYDDEFDDAAMQ